MDLLALNQRALDQAERVIATVQPADLAKPTPCTEWDVRALINHMTGANYYFAHLAKGGDAAAGGDSINPDFIGDDPLGSYRKSSEESMAAWRSPGALEGDVQFPWGAVPRAATLGFNFSDAVTHTWDLAKAIGHSDELDPELYAVTLEISRQGISDQFRGDGPGAMFHHEVKIADDAPIGDRLAAFLGRQP